MCFSCVNVVYEYQYYPYVHSRKTNYCHDCTRHLSGSFTRKPASQERITLKKYFEIWSNSLPGCNETGLLCLRTWKKKKKKNFSQHKFLFKQTYTMPNIFCDSTCTSNSNINELIISTCWHVVELWPLYHDTKKTHKLHLVWSMIILIIFCQDGNCQKKRNQEEVTLKHW